MLDRHSYTFCEIIDFPRAMERIISVKQATGITHPMIIDFQTLLRDQCRAPNASVIRKFSIPMICFHFIYDFYGVDISQLILMDL